MTNIADRLDKLRDNLDAERDAATALSTAATIDRMRGYVSRSVDAHRHIIDTYAELTRNTDRFHDPALHLQWHVLGMVVDQLAAVYSLHPSDGV